MAANIFSKDGQWRKVVRRLKQYTTTRFNYYTKPMFIIIGVQRSGTTSLHRWLSLHPQITPCDMKEVHYFNRNWERGNHWYHSLFPLPSEMGQDNITFEATPRYFYEPPVAARIQQYNPDIKLVVILRNPIERAYSHWAYANRGLPQPALTFEATMQRDITDIEKNGAFTMLDSPSNMVDRGFYYDQFLRLFNYFDPSQVHICEYEDLKLNPTHLLDELVAFLGLKPYQWGDDVLRVWNKSPDNEPMTESTRAMLRDYYAEHNRKLFELIGQEYDWR